MPFGARPPLADNSAVELRVAATIEVDEVQSCGGVRGEWVGMKWARVLFFPFACVVEHTVRRGDGDESCAIVNHQD